MEEQYNMVNLNTLVNSIERLYKTEIYIQHLATDRKAGEGEGEKREGFEEE